MLGTSFPEVLERTRTGDPSAFAAIWRRIPAPAAALPARHRPRSRRRRRVETWATVSTTISSFDGDETAFRAWLFTVARRRAIDHFRREARRPSVPVDPVVLGRTPLRRAHRNRRMPR